MSLRFQSRTKLRSSPASTLPSNKFRPRPFDVKSGPNASQDRHMPDMNAQPEPARRPGFNFGQVRVFPEGHTQTRPHPIQAKLTVGPAGDRFEQEADRIAKRFMSATASDRQRPVQPVDHKDPVQTKTLLQPQASVTGGKVDSGVEKSVEKRRGRGQALSGNVRASMEHAFNADFSGVRVHADAEADALNQSMSARVFTTGRDIFFGQGEYNPGSASGQVLLAHELTHVVQQGGGQLQRPQTQAKGVMPQGSMPSAPEAEMMGASATSRKGNLSARLPSAQRSADSGKALGQVPEITQRAQPGRVHRTFGSKKKTPPPLWEEVNKGFGDYRSKSSPKTFADQLAESSESFNTLRGKADAAIQDKYEKNLEYSHIPKKGGGGGTAYYKESGAHFSKEQHPASIVANMIFETANAVQRKKFDKVEADYNDGSLADKPLKHYGINDSEFSPDLHEELNKGSLAAKRSLIQEHHEYMSGKIAQPALQDAEKNATSPYAKATFGVFNDRVAHKNFMSYYNGPGKSHRSATQIVLEKAEEQKK